MELSVIDRLMLRGILPEKGDFLTFKAVRELHELLSFDDKEIQAFGLKQEDDQIKWNADADTPREFTFNKTQLRVITETLTKLNDSGEITAKTFGLYEKFVENDKE